MNKIIRKGQYDIVQANAGDTLKYTTLSKFFFRWQSILVYRNANRMSDFMKTPLHKVLNRVWLSQVDYFVSVSKDSRADLIGLYPAVSTRSVTIPIGTYTFDDILPMAVAASIQRPIFINIGSLVPEKNHAFLLNIFAGYVKEHSHATLWIVGDGKLRDNLEQQIVTLGLSDSITLWGYRKDVISLLKASDAVVMTSLIEGLPGVILEALSCGIPVVTSNVGGIGEAIENGYNGYCLNGFDVKDYVRHMDEVTSSPTVREKFKKNGKTTVGEKFLLPVIAGKFMGFYKSCKMGAI